MFEVHQKIQDLVLPNNKTWEDFCFKVPIVRVDFSSLLGKKRRRKRQAFSDFKDEDFEIPESDPSVDYYPKPFCNVVESKFQSCSFHCTPLNFK